MRIPRRLNKRKQNDKMRKHSRADQPEAKQNDRKRKQGREDHLDRWIWTAKGSMTWRQFYDKNGR